MTRRRVGAGDRLRASHRRHGGIGTPSLVRANNRRARRADQSSVLTYVSPRSPTARRNTDSLLADQPATTATCGRRSNDSTVTGAPATSLPMSAKDGMMHGPNSQLYDAVARGTTAPVIASGGISTINDLVMLAEAAGTSANIRRFYRWHGALCGPVHASRSSGRDATGGCRLGAFFVFRHISATLARWPKPIGSF
jgi:Histidine biosynthesis protein